MDEIQEQLEQLRNAFADISAEVEERSDEAEKLFADLCEDDFDFANLTKQQDDMVRLLVGYATIHRFGLRLAENIELIAAGN